MLVDHGFTVPMSLFWRNNSYGRVKTIPVCINTVQHPLPSPLRCYKLGQAIGRAVASYPKDLKVVILGTGGMSHQLDGERAVLANDPEALIVRVSTLYGPGRPQRPAYVDAIVAQAREKAATGGGSIAVVEKPMSMRRRSSRASGKFTIVMTTSTTSDSSDGSRPP